MTLQARPPSQNFRVTSIWKHLQGISTILSYKVNVTSTWPQQCNVIFVKHVSGVGLKQPAFERRFNVNSRSLVTFTSLPSSNHSLNLQRWVKENTRSVLYQRAAVIISLRNWVLTLIVIKVALPNIFDYFIEQWLDRGNIIVCGSLAENLATSIVF